MAKVIEQMEGIFGFKSKFGTWARFQPKCDSMTEVNGENKTLRAPVDVFKAFLEGIEGCYE